MRQMKEEMDSKRWLHYGKANGFLCWPFRATDTNFKGRWREDEKKTNACGKLKTQWIPQTSHYHNLIEQFQPPLITVGQFPYCCFLISFHNLNELFIYWVCFHVHDERSIDSNMFSSKTVIYFIYVIFLFVWCKIIVYLKNKKKFICKLYRLNHINLCVFYNFLSVISLSVFSAISLDCIWYENINKNITLFLHIYSIYI